MFSSLDILLAKFSTVSVYVEFHMEVEGEVGKWKTALL